MVADEQRRQGHDEQRQETTSVEVPDQTQQRQASSRRVQDVTAGQFCRRRIHAPRQLAISDDRPSKGDGTDEHTKEQFDPQDRDLDAVFLGQQRCEPFGRLAGGVIHRQHVAQFDMRVIADEHRRQTHKAVHRGNQFGHLRHLHFCRQLIADGTATRDQDQRQQPEAGPRPDQCRSHGQSHAHDPVPYRALGAFLTRQPAKAEDEEDGGDYVSRCCKTKIHLPEPFTIFGTWQACAVSRGSHQRC